MRGAREAPAPRDSLNFRRASLLSRNEFESGTFTIVVVVVVVVVVFWEPQQAFKASLQGARDTTWTKKEPSSRFAAGRTLFHV